MSMNIKPVPTLDNEVNEIRLATAEIVNQDILPVEKKLWGWVSDSANAPKEVLEEAKELRHQVQDDNGHHRAKSAVIQYTVTK